MTFDDPRIARSVALLRAAANPPPGRLRIVGALGLGLGCHTLFAAGVGAMIYAMFHGMTRGVGDVAWPWAALVNAMLLAQFPLAHSWLLTGRGGRALSRVFGREAGSTLAPTTYALIASVQLIALFALWTPSGIVWWRADGAAFWALCCAYGAAWLLLSKATFDAGIEVQSGALGWMSWLARIKPVFPDMPTAGLFRVIRQPIYVAFMLTLWTVPVWTPDQLAVAVSLTAYCLLAPRLKERRFARRYGARFAAYKAETPYAAPRLFGGREPRNR
ncbi:MAG: isoprenylcysteine carboxylmethyltransferase family protein [Pseudomonadota bacterium]